MTGHNDEANALLTIGEIVCARIPTSSKNVTAWAGIAPLADNALRVFAFEAVAQGEVRNLFKKRCAHLGADSSGEPRVADAMAALRDWGVDGGALAHAALDSRFPVWLTTILIPTKRFNLCKTGCHSSIADVAYARLSIGESIGTEVASSSDDLRAWVSVEPRADDQYLRDREYRCLRALRFEMPSSIDGPTYDYDYYMKNTQQLDIEDGADFDDACTRLDALLSSWGIEHCRLDKLAADYPIL